MICVAKIVDENDSHLNKEERIKFEQKVNQYFNVNDKIYILRHMLHFL